MYQAKHIEEPAADFLIERGNKFERGALFQIVKHWNILLTVVVKLLYSLLEHQWLLQKTLSAIKAEVSQIFVSLSFSHSPLLPFPTYTGRGKRNEKDK